MVEPGHRKNKNGKVVKDRQHDIDAITRMIQNHFNEEEAYNVQSKFLFAYSKLFNCSLDFLYGTVKVRSTDPDMNAICKKTGLSEKVVERLMSNSNIDLDSFMFNFFEYEYLYTDFNLKADLTVTDYWNELLESDLFMSLPEKWVHMACALQLYKETQVCLEEINKFDKKHPDRDSFISIIENYEAKYGRDPEFYIDPGQEFDYDYEMALSKLEYIENQLKSDKSEREMVYWGCAGQFDRFLQNYFHDRAESFIVPRTQE